jgi:hypothetical protein
VRTQRSEDQSFLFETTVEAGVTETVKEMVEVHNLRLRIQRSVALRLPSALAGRERAGQRGGCSVGRLQHRCTAAPCHGCTRAAQGQTSGAPERTAQADAHTSTPLLLTLRARTAHRLKLEGEELAEYGPAREPSKMGVDDVPGSELTLQGAHYKNDPTGRRTGHGANATSEAPSTSLTHHLAMTDASSSSCCNLAPPPA